MSRSLPEKPDPAPGRRRTLTLVRVCLLALGGIVLLVSGAGMLIGSGWFRNRIATAVSSRIGHMVHIGDLSLTPGGKLLVERFSIVAQPGSGGQAPPSPFELMEIGRLRVKPHWTSLLSGTIRLEEVSVIDPSMAALRNEDGSLLAALPKRPLRIIRHNLPPELAVAPPLREQGGKFVPPLPPPTPQTQDPPPTLQAQGPAPSSLTAEPPAGPAGPKDTGQAPDDAATRPGVAGTDDAPPDEQATRVATTTDAVTGSDTATATPRGMAPPPPTASVTDTPPATPDSSARGLLVDRIDRKIAIDNLSVEGGSFTFHSAPLDYPVLDVDGYGMKLRKLASENPEGEIAVGSLRILGFEAARNILLHLAVEEDNRVHFDSLDSDILGGFLEGEAEIDLLRPGTPFAAAFEISGIDASRFPILPPTLFADLEFKAGTVDVMVTARGFLAIPETVLATVRIRARDLTLENDELLSELGSKWNVRSFHEPIKVRAIDLVASIVEKTGIIEQLAVKTDHGIFKSRGYVYPDGELEMAGRIYITNEVVHLLEKAHDLDPSLSRPEFVPLRNTTWFTRTQDISIRGDIRSPVADPWKPGQMTSLPQFISLLATGPARDSGMPLMPMPDKGEPR